MITRAQRIRQQIGEFFADDEAPDSIAPEDTILHNLGKPFPDGRIPLCPTCGRDVIPGFMTPQMVQCPGCFTDIDLANGKYAYRTKSGNMSRGQYGS